jgi:nucleotide-binding universal stress UspA family protein
MTDLSDRFRILVALDLSDTSDIVVEHAIDQAARHDAVDLHFLTVQERRGESLDELKQRLAPAAFDALALLGRDGPDWRARLHVRAGEPSEEIAELAAEIRADLVVIGRFGAHRSWRRLGTIASRVIEMSPCPVLIVGLTEHAVAPVDACAECVRVRDESDGERWFCDQHLAPDRADVAAAFLPMNLTFAGGGPMW